MTDQDLQELWEDLSFNNPDIPSLEVFQEAQKEGRLNAITKLTSGEATITGKNAGHWKWEME